MSTFSGVPPPFPAERKGNEAGIKREQNDPAHMIAFMLGGVAMRHLWVTYSAEDKLDREAEQQAV